MLENQCSWRNTKCPMNKSSAKLHMQQQNMYHFKLIRDYHHHSCNTKIVKYAVIMESRIDALMMVDSAQY